MIDKARAYSPEWTIQSLTDTSTLILHKYRTVYAMGTAPDTFVLKAILEGEVVEDASICHSREQGRLTINVTAGGSKSRLQAVLDDGCISLRYYRDNVLLLDDEASLLSNYSAPALKIATDTSVYERTPQFARLLGKIREDSFFRERVLSEINQFADPGGGFGPIDYCDWVCKQCWHGMYLPHSCLACIFCNGFTATPPNGGID